MKIAFYAPLKSPHYPTPSGDRLLARLLIKALELAGHTVTVAAELRSYEGQGSPEKQLEIKKAGRAFSVQLIDEYRKSGPPDVWFSYHIYHKAPDWMGPLICQAFGIPYVVAEASVSPAYADSPWQEGHKQAMACIRRADAMVSLNQRDLECALPYLSSTARLLQLKPFIDEEALSPVVARPRQASNPHVKLVSVARMRRGDKARSWMLLNELLERIPGTHWTFDVVGDGAERPTIEQGLRRTIQDRVHFHGRLEGTALSHVLNQSDLFVWPALNEAFGMSLLEAQAHGIAVAAGRHGGVPSVVYNGLSGILFDTNHLDAAADAISYLIDRPRVLERMGTSGYEMMHSYHSLSHASSRLNELIEAVCEKSS